MILKLLKSPAMQSSLIVGAKGWLMRKTRSSRAICLKGTNQSIISRTNGLASKV